MRFGGLTTDVKIRLMTVTTFFCKCNRIRVSADGFFLHVTFSPVLFENWLKRSFRRLYPKKFHGFIEKRKKSFDFFVIKISTPTNLMCLWSKLTTEICQKAGWLDGKMTQNQLKTCMFSLFFSRKITTFKAALKSKHYFLTYFRGHFLS